MKFEEIDGVRTLRDFPEEGIKKGEVGTVVVAFTIPDEAYEVEFCDEYGRTRAMFAILPEDLELVVSQRSYNVYIPPNTDLPHASGN